MSTIEISSKLESVNFTTDQARTITEILESHHSEIASKNDVELIVSNQVTKAKYELVRWIVGAVIVYGLIATIFKLLA